MQVDDPPYLSVGTAVSAKYKGAFCEARVSKVVRVVKCKVTYKMGLGNATVTDEHIKGTLRVGQMVQAKHPEKKELVDATITKIQDCSQYTVVFDDGDITTLKRTALCLKSGRHFNESETLDQLPLTHPEHFGNPVVGGRRGRRNRQLKEDSSDGENEEENEPDLEGYTVDIGRVVSVELSEKKRSKDNWFPGLIVIPSAQPTVRINVKDEFLVRSFKDGRYYTVPKKEVSEFNKELSEKVDGSNLAEAIQKALKYLDSNELPVHWERSSLFNSQNLESDSEENVTDSSDDEPCEEKDRFVAQLYKFMDEAGTPLNKTPTVNSKDVDLHRLFRVVQKLGGYNRVTNQNKWRSVTIRLHLPSIQNTFNQVKSIYKKCLFSYESFHRTLGVTMLNHTRSTKKNRGRSLIRDKDRATPVNSPKPDKEEEPVEKKEEPKEQPSQPVPEVKPKRKLDLKKDDDKKKKDVGEVSDANSNSEVVETFDSVPGPSKEPGRPKRIDNKTIKDKKIKAATGEKVKALVEKFEEQSKKEDEDKTQQQTRSKSQNIIKQKETVPPPTLPPVEKKVEAKVHPPRDLTPSKTAIAKPTKKTSDDEKKRGRKRTITEDKSTSDSSTSESAPSLPTPIPSVSTAVTIPLNATSSVANSNINIGAKLKVYYGPTHESKVTYEAKILEVDKDSAGNTMYLVHYTGWNTRYDEWIPPTRIAENLSATTKAKRLKRGAAAAAAASAAASASKTSMTVKVPTKRGRGISITGKNTAPAEIPRSTTPSSVTSTGSRTKSPATPATRSTSRLTAKQDISRRSRRTSVQTDASNHSESDSDVSESEAELTRTRSGVKTDEPEVKTYKRKTNKPPAQTTAPKTEKSKDKDDIDSEKEEDSDRPIKRTKKLKKSPEKSTEESDDDTNPPKGRDFDLNQIRSELKGFNKALKVPPLDSADKDAISSSDDSTVPLPEKTAPEEPDEKKDKVLEKSSSSEDIYEFKEPEPFEFETRTKLTDEKNAKKRLVPRIFEDLEKSPSKKKLINSPSKLDQPVIDIPELPEKKRFRRPPLRKQEDSDDEDELPSQPPKKDEDPFDKLVESPSFNLVKTNANNEKLIDAKQRDINSILDEPLNLFRELPETEEDYVRDLGLSDCESQSQHIFSRPGELFSDTFSKSSPDHSALDLEFPLKPDETKLKDSDDEDLIREQIERVIQQSSSTDDDSTDLLITPPTTSYQMKKREEPKLLIPKPEVNVVVEEKSPIVEPVRSPEPVKKEDPIVDSQPSCSAVKHISPALQETDSSLLEAICSQPVLLTSKLDDAKDLNVKTGTKIADSILQKFNSIKNKIEGKSSRGEIESNAKKTDSSKVEVKQEPVISEEAKVDIKTENEPLVKHPEEEEKITVPEPQKLKLDIPTSKYSNANENRRRKKAISRAYIETDSDSSDDSEQLVIARSDEDSQTTSLGPKDNKESDSNLSAQIPSTDDSQPQQEEQRNFKFEDIKKESSPAPEIETVKPDPEPVKEEEPDSQLHTLLLCEETLPRSPAPVPESSNIVEQKPAKAILEMPFASAPSTSNTKMILLEHQHKTVAKIQPQQQPQQHIPPQQLAAPINIPLDRDNRPGDAAAVLDNTPPTTPESSISNLSPRGENGDLSPNTVDNESCKSNEPENEYSGARRNSSNKVSPYSEEDTQMTIGETSAINKKVREEPTPSLRKRRKSFRGPDEIPAKRGRKPLNRSRHNSDSDDTSDHSNTGSTNIGLYDRSQRSPRPSRYNFFVEFDPSLDSSQRIAVLQQKLSELRKTYADVKAELAAVERRRKKIKRREREAQKASKQEMVCV